MKSRSLKPGLFENEILGSLDPMAQLLFAGLPLLADREGRLEDRPLRIKGLLFPYRNYPNIDEHLTLLARHGFLIRYQIRNPSTLNKDGASLNKDSACLISPQISLIRYIQIRNFVKHQKPHRAEKKSEIPPPDESGNSPELIVHSMTVDSLTDISTYVEEGGNKPPSPPKIDFQNLVSIWNEILGDLCPKIQRLTEQRKRLLANRLLDSFGGDAEQWRAYCSTIRKSSFCTGENDRGWRAHIDWALKPQTIAKLQEGNYADSTRNPKTNQPARSKTAESLAALHAAGNRVIQRRGLEPGAGEGTAGAAGMPGALADGNGPPGVAAIAGQTAGDHDLFGTADAALPHGEHERA